MQLKLDRLDHHLQSRLAAIYVLSGDEPLQIQDARDAIIAAARVHGIQERTILQVETGFDWDTLRALADSPGLFAEQRLFDLRMPSGKPGDRGGKTLQAYAERPPPDDTLLLTTGRLDRRVTNSKWYKALDAAGMTLQVWPISANQLPAWIRTRALASGCQLTEAAARLLAERSEGNLLACNQELRKLSLLFDDPTLDVEHVLEAVSDSARFSAFDLVDCSLEGRSARAVRISRGLMEEGAEPLQVLGSLLWALRAMTQLSYLTGHGKTLEQTLSGQFMVWRNRRRLVQAALQRHSQRAWLGMIAHANRIDKRIKGRTSLPGQSSQANRQDAWDQIMALTLQLCGAKTFPAPDV